ncbi:MAG: tetratricopeptide repeat protein [Polaromonas sp.]|nr:tetratricopeptide repeat protein [Polaromonas sp.]
MPNVFNQHALFVALRGLFVVATLSASLAYADDYADVSKLLRAGQINEAMAKADQYLAGKPRDPQMRFIKGVIQTEAGKTNDAIATFTQVTQDYPELPEPYNNLAVLYAGQSQFDKARAALEMAIRTNPSYATAHENLGDVYARLASQAYGKALQLDGSNAGVQPKLALIRTLFSADSKTSTQKPAVAVAPAPAPTLAKPLPVPATSPAATAVASGKPAPVVTPTPAPLPAPVTSAAPAVSTASDKDVETAVRTWAQAWAAKDMAAYFASYGQNFDTPGTRSRKSWESDRRARIVGKSSISVKVTDLSITVQGAKATARFQQDYNAGSLSVTSTKTLEMAKAGDRWVIVKESTGG